jgi:hypothetical protein
MVVSSRHEAFSAPVPILLHWRIRYRAVRCIYRWRPVPELNSMYRDVYEENEMERDKSGAGDVRYRWLRYLNNLGCHVRLCCKHMVAAISHTNK